MMSSLAAFAEVDTVQASLPSLQHFGPRFFVPQLTDKPQNPILDTLGTENPYAPSQAPKPKIVTKKVAFTPSLRETSHSMRSGRGNGLMSWDALSRRCCPSDFTPLLSEQRNATFAAARYHVLPRLNDTHAPVIRVTLKELYKSLRLTVLGFSSNLHSWDAVSENFSEPRDKIGRRRVIVIDDMDEVVSESFIRRFLVIGTLLRRLETLIASLRKRPAQDGPIIHAFTHSLSTLVAFLREELEHWPPEIVVHRVDSLMLSTMWMKFEKFEHILRALATLCNREDEKTPLDYLSLDPSPELLLSHIYGHLHSHIEMHSSRLTISALAYILTSSSRDYFRSICKSVGLDIGAWSGSPEARKFSSSTTGWHGDEVDGEKDDLGMCKLEEKFPSFFPSDLVDSLLTAKKSLEILRAARPDHSFRRTHCDIRWIWSESELQLIWNKKDKVDFESIPRVLTVSSPLTTDVSDMAYFRIFDHEPGSHVSQSPLANSSHAFPTCALRLFMATFPESLPSITPTLADLTSLIFSPLLEHTERLSLDLLSIFLSPSSSLNFRAHLVLLRSYLMLTSQSFRSRLTTALYSDAADCDADDKTVRVVLTGQRQKRSDSVQENVGRRPWAVGLAPYLTDREAWPPGGADLSFLLRTVIVDSIGLIHGNWDDQHGFGEVSSGLQAVFLEAENRLAFAIRELPLGPGRSQWLNPLSIEALDFLFLDYKPPRPLGVLITPEILSRYQRLFAFLLRMLRVESAICALFRMSRDKSKPLFPTLTSSNRLLSHFRFTVHSFVASLMEHIFDTAIRGHFDAFILRLSRDNPGFSDVFSLAGAHAAVLDGILSACLLRSGQKGVGDLLRRALEIVLEFCILAGELHRGCLDEHQAAPLLKSHFGKYCETMATLMKVLKVLVERGDMQPGGLHESPKSSNPLHHLLVRLDKGDWWSKMNR